MSGSAMNTLIASVNLAHVTVAAVISVRDNYNLK